MVTREERRLQNRKQDNVAFLNYIPSSLSMKEGETVEAIVNGRLREYKKRKGLVFYKDYVLDGNEKVERSLDIGANLNIAGTLVSDGNIQANSNYVLEGYSTGRNVLRAMKFIVKDGTDATTIKVSSTNQFNHTAISEVDNVAENTTTSGFTLDVLGQDLLIVASTNLEGNVVGVLSASISKNASAADYTVDVHKSGNDLRLRLLNATTGIQKPWTDAVDGGEPIELKITYLTSG